MFLRFSTARLLLIYHLIYHHRFAVFLKCITRNMLNSNARKVERKLHDDENIRAMMMDLSKAFECIKHDQMLIDLVVENGLQRVKINGWFSTYKQHSLGVPQRLFLGPLFFDMYLNNLLLAIHDTDVCIQTVLLEGQRMIQE